MGSVTVEAEATKRGGPTDEEILQFENAIKAEQAEVQPLISALLPFSMVEEEYMTETGINFLPKIVQLKERYGTMRRSRGDGNCFFRSLAFALLEGMKEDIAAWMRIRIKELLDAAGFEVMAYEDFFDEFFALAAEITLKKDRGEWLAAEWQSEPSRSHSVVVLLRLVASAFLRTNAEAYEPFLFELSSRSEEASSPPNMTMFCQRQVECLGVESDQIHIVALSNALRLHIVIGYLDQSDSPLQLDFEPDDSWKTPAMATIHLLYRPGHYDILYPR